MKNLKTFFFENKDSLFSKKQICSGFLIISRNLGLKTYIGVIWDILTALIVYSPSVNNYLFDIISSLNRKWDNLSETKKINIVAALSYLDRHGKVERVLENYTLDK